MTSERVLVTGAGGFVGKHLVDLLAAAPGVEVFGTFHGSTADQVDDAKGLSGSFTGDLTTAPFADTVVRAANPRWIVHLAAQSSVAQSWRDPAGTLTNNIVGQLTVLEAVLRYAPRARVLVVGSSEEYGHVGDEESPIGELAPLRPDSPYATSKVAQDFLGLQYHLGRQVDVVRVRPFNLFGPGQSDRFAIGSFARQIAEAERDLQPAVISVGNLAARRDFTDVRDAVRAYWTVLQKGQSGDVYNVGGGGVHAIGDVLSALLRISTQTFRIEVDPARIRPTDAPLIAPDIGRLRDELGWEPTIPFDQTIRDILDSWRARVSVG